MKPRILALVAGQNEFIELVGDVTVSQIILIIASALFIVAVSKSIEKYIISRYKAKKKKDEQLAQALEAVKMYPELERQIKELRDEYLSAQKESTEHIKAMEEKIQKREVNRIRDRLLTIYRHYTNDAINPTHSWTQMEAETFWAQFEDYEEAGGDDTHMNTVVQPAMRQLIVTDLIMPEM